MVRVKGMGCTACPQVQCSWGGGCNISLEVHRKGPNTKFYCKFHSKQENKNQIDLGKTKQVTRKGSD